MVNLVDSVITALEADSELKSLVGGRIYWIKSAAEKPQLPMLTVIESGNAEIRSSDDEEYTDEVEIQVDIWANGSFLQIKNAVQRVMRKNGYTHSAMPDEYISELAVYHKAMKFTIQVENK